MTLGDNVKIIKLNLASEMHKRTHIARNLKECYNSLKNR